MDDCSLRQEEGSTGGYEWVAGGRREGVRGGCHGDHGILHFMYFHRNKQRSLFSLFLMELCA